MQGEGEEEEGPRTGVPPPGKDLKPEAGKGPGTRDWGTSSPLNRHTPVKRYPPVVLRTRPVITIGILLPVIYQGGYYLSLEVKKFLCKVLLTY